MIKRIIQENEAEQRLDKFLLKVLDQASPAFLYKMLRKKNITLNGKRAEGKERLQKGDEVTLYLSEETIARFQSGTQKEAQPPKSTGIRLDILYEDPDILLINKPVGLLSQKAGAGDISLNDALVEYVRTRQSEEERAAAFTPSICNRLDRNTSGIITGGKTLAGLQFLSHCFRKRLVDKWYLALVRGVMEEDLALEGWLLKDEAANQVTLLREPREGADLIRTEVHPLQNDGTFTLVKLKLLTGKTHQLRAVLADLGHPVMGDPKYGDPKADKQLRELAPLRSQLLHAHQLAFPKLDGRFEYLGERTFTAPLPKAFATCLNKLNLKIPGG